VTSPARSIALDLQLTGPGRCARLYPLYITIRHARRGHFRFGPRVPGARPRSDGKRLCRWCRGTYHFSVVITAEFQPDVNQTLTSGQFTVR
jgi:hypothetical protein